MADVETGDVLRIGASFLLDGVFEIANVFHVRVTAGGSLDFSDASDDIQEYVDAIYDENKLWLSDHMGSYLLSLQNLTQDTTYGAFPFAAPIVGGASGQYLPLGTCCLTWGRTFKPRVQSRKYWGVFAEEGIVDGAWVASLLTACQAAHSVHALSFAGTNGLTVLGVAYNRTAGTTTDMTSVTGAIEPAYQRRRRRGRGS